jgi:hypothetical protein
VRHYLFIIAAFALGGCATYQHAQNIKLVSFDENVKKGTSVGNIRGEDCTWSVLGYKLGGEPTVDKAFINAKNQAGGLESAGFGDLSKKDRSQAIRYANNVSTEYEGFNAVVVGKQCLVVKGVGFR